MARLSSHFGLRDPRLQSLLFEQIVPATVTADSNQTLTPTQVLGGWIFRSGLTAGRTDTLPSAAALAEAIQGVFVGTTFSFRVRNVSAAAQTHTIAVGAGGTLATNNAVTTAQNNDHSYRIVFTNATPGSEAYTLYSLGSGGTF